MTFFDRLRFKTAQWIAGQTIRVSDGSAWSSLRKAYSTDAGIIVTGEGALRSNTVYACINLIANTIAMLGFDIYLERKSGGKDVATDHPLHQLLKWEPNRHQTSFEFVHQSVFHHELYGNSYAHLIKNRSVGVMRIDSLLAPQMRKIDTSQPEWIYRYTEPAGRLVDYPESEVLHIRNVSLDGIIGLSPIELMAQRVGLDLAVESFGAKFFGKGGILKAIAEYSGWLDKEKREILRKRLTDDTAESHEILVLEGDIKYKPVGIPPEQAQFLQTQNVSAISLCRVFGVPPTMVGLLERATYNNQEQLLLQYLTHGIQPRVERFEKSMRRSLLTDEEKRQGYFIHSKLQKLMRADVKTRGEIYERLMRIGALNPNEIRDLEDMNPRAGGDKYALAANIFGPQDGGSDEESPTQQEDEDDG